MLTANLRFAIVKMCVLQLPLVGLVMVVGLPAPPEGRVMRAAGCTQTVAEECCALISGCSSASGGGVVSRV